MTEEEHLTLCFLALDSRSQLLLPAVTMEMALLLLLLFGGFWAQVMSQENLPNTPTMLPFTPNSESPSTSEALSTYSSIATVPVTGGPKESISPPRGQTTAPASSTPLGTPELSSFLTPAGASGNTPVPELTTSQEVSTEASSVLFPKSSGVASDPPVTITNPVTSSAVASTPLETFKGTSAPPVTVTSSTMTSGPFVATTVSSETSGPPVTMATGSLGPSKETHGLPATIAISSVESSSVAGGTPVSSTKISTTSTPNPITTVPPRPRSSGMLLVPMLIALTVVLVLVALLLLWRQRQKRRTGALTLSRGGKRNGAVDAWAGPARVPDEEATTASGSGGNKSSEAPETDGSGQRPTLTTFFSRRKSRQGSVALEELKPGTGPNLKGEEEPLVGSEDEAVETPTSDGPQAKDGAAPQSL